MRSPVRVQRLAGYSRSADASPLLISSARPARPGSAGAGVNRSRQALSRAAQQEDRRWLQQRLVALWRRRSVTSTTRRSVRPSECRIFKKTGESMGGEGFGAPRGVRSRKGGRQGGANAFILSPQEKGPGRAATMAGCGPDSPGAASAQGTLVAIQELGGSGAP
jgi:hypothetical protein